MACASIILGSSLLRMDALVLNPDSNNMQIKLNTNKLVFDILILQKK